MLDLPSTLRKDESSLLLQALCITLASDTVAAFKRPRADAVPPCPPRRLSGRNWFPARCEVGGVVFEIHPVLEIIIYVYSRIRITPPHSHWDKKNTPPPRIILRRKLLRGVVHKTSKSNETFVLLMGKKPFFNLISARAVCK